MKLNIQLFASGTINGSSTASIGRIRIDWSSTPSDAIQNKSSVSAVVYVWRSTNYNTNGTFSGTLTINGNSISISKKRSDWNTTPKEVGSYTIDVPHNEDGTKTCNISVSLTQTGTSMAGTYTASQDVVLDTIPRASVFNSLSMVVNNDSSITITANITRRNASFTDTLTLCDANFELDDGTNTITFSDSVNQTAKARFYQIMGNNTQASYTAILTTKSSGSQVGNTSTQTAIVSLPSYSISIGTITSSDDNADNYIRSGSTYKVSDFTSANTYLQGFSNPRLSFTLGSSSGYLYGNTINISGDASASGLMLGNNSVALGTNFTGGSKTLTASDGRKTANGSITLTRKDWNTPSVSIVLERQSATGQTIDYEITYNFTSVSGGLTPKLSASYTYNGTTYTIYSEQALSNTSGTLSGTITLANADDYKYSISASTTLTDTIDYQVLANTQIPGGKPAIYTYKDSSANNLVDIYGDLDVENSITAGGSIITTGNDTGFTCDNATANRTGKFTSSGSGRLGIYDTTNSNWVIMSETNQEVKIPHDIDTSGHQIKCGSPEIYAPIPFIDFHFNNSSSDYTSRIIEWASGILTMENNLKVNGWVKSNNIGVFKFANSINFGSSWNDYTLGIASTEYNNTGITLSNNQLTIPANVSYIKVSVYINYYNTDNRGDKICHLHYGNNSAGLFYVGTDYGNYYMATGTAIIPVSQGMNVWISLASSSSGNMRLFDTESKVVVEIIA